MTLLATQGSGRVSGFSYTKLQVLKSIIGKSDNMIVQNQGGSSVCKNWVTLSDESAFRRSTKRSPKLPALSGLGTPPTKTVFRGSNGNEASRTKSASLSRHGLI